MLSYIGVLSFVQAPAELNEADWGRVERNAILNQVHSAFDGNPSASSGNFHCVFELHMWRLRA